MLRIRARAVFLSNNSSSFVGFVSGCGVATHGSSAPSHVVLTCCARFISSSQPRLMVGVPTLGLLQRSGGVTNSSDLTSGNNRKGGRSFESSDPSSSSRPNHDEDGHGEGFSSPSTSASTRVDETSAATAHINSLSGVPGHKGTMAAFATMRLRRVAASEELSTMRREMISELGDKAENPTDDEVKAWKAVKVKAETDERFKRQRQARDAFVREILGPATTPASASASSSTSHRREAGAGDEAVPNTNMIGKTKYVLHSSDGSIDGGVNHGRLWAPKDGVAPSGFVPTEETKAATGASTPASSSSSSSKPKVAVNSQEGMNVLNFPNEETDERLREAARKYQTSHLTSYGMAEMQHSGKKLMLRIAIAAIFLLLVPLVVDPMQSMGDEHGDEALKERVRQQQEENVRIALLTREKQKGMGAQLLKSSKKSVDEKDPAGESALNGKDESEADAEDDNFYSGGSGVANVGPSFLTNFNPVMSMFSVIHYYYLVYSNIQSGREENTTYGDKAQAKERREQARDLLGSMKYGVEANRPESERRN